MCEVTGLLTAPGRTEANADLALARMRDAFADRGPNDAWRCKLLPR